MNKLESLNFKNRFASLPEIFHSQVIPTPLSRPYLVSFNPDVAALLDLHVDEAGRADFAAYFTGNRLLPGSVPVSMLYAGHQFGRFVQQLGDGRAILLGEIENSDGESWGLQLKGAGVTPYSRSGDGRAVLRSSIREYLCSAAMHGLGIPTTRALCIVGSDEEVYRESIETAAIVTRVAESFVRFGSFEVFYYRGQHQQVAELADFLILHHYPHLQQMEDRYSCLLREITVRTARLIAQWQAVGFAHGVMNTDNMSVLGETLDYGPFGFMEAYDPSFICNHSDHGGRYAYDQQPYIGQWNLSALAQAMSPIVPQQEAGDIIASYGDIFAEHYVQLMCAKLGVKFRGLEDFSLIGPLLEMMRESRVDYTNFFRGLGNFKSADGEINAMLRDQFINREAFDAWSVNYSARLREDGLSDVQRKSGMDKVSPKFILRNYLAQVAIEKVEKHRDFSEIDRLLSLLRSPFDEHPEFAGYTIPAPAWARNLEVSCSS